ncbi:MAG: hypothetical protein JJU02_03360 [Cryomorphaceae bacterium]|nr:hypothetical protein [Cryomorphaceae bacterium]
MPDTMVVRSYLNVNDTTDTLYLDMGRREINNEQLSKTGELVQVVQQIIHFFSKHDNGQLEVKLKSLGQEQGDILNITHSGNDVVIEMLLEYPMVSAGTNTNYVPHFIIGSDTLNDVMVGNGSHPSLEKIIYTIETTTTGQTGLISAILSHSQLYRRI